STRRRFDLLSGGAGGALLLGCIYCNHRFKVQFVGHATSKRYCAYDITLADTIRDWFKKKELAIFDSIKEAEELGYEPYKSGPQRNIMDESEIQSAVREMSQQILRDCQDFDHLLILGIRTKGSHLAQRIAAELEAQRKRKFEVGEIEIYGVGDEI